MKNKIMKQTSLMLPEEMMNQVKDSLDKELGDSITRFVREAIKEKLDRIKNKEKAEDPQ